MPSSQRSSSSCVGVFTEVDHKLVAVVSTDQRGRFELKGIPEGTYRLVVKYEGFSPANAKVRIEHSRRNKLLTVQMRPTGLDSGSVVGDSLLEPGLHRFGRIEGAHLEG